VTAIELIKQVAELPQREKTLFEQLFHGMKNANHAPGPASQPTWPDFGQRLRRIYGDKIAPDSQAIVDDGRGDR